VERRRLQNEDLYDVYSSPNIIRVRKFIRMGWACNVARMEKRRGAYRVLVWKPEGTGQLGRPGLRCRIILKLMFQKWDVGAWTGLICLRIGTGGGHL
jgi:hypothetical protein